MRASTADGTVLTCIPLSCCHAVCQPGTTGDECSLETCAEGYEGETCNTCASGYEEAFDCHTNCIDTADCVYGPGTSACSLECKEKCPTVYQASKPFHYSFYEGDVDCGGSPGLLHFRHANE